MKENHSDFILFKTEDEKISVDVRFEDETVWLTQDQMALLFGKAKSTINEHIQNVFTEGELDETVCLQKFGISEFQQKTPNYYNLDVIISVGYRVKSMRGTQFRQWATKRLNEYIRKGFVMDDERLKNLGGGGYWKETILLTHCQNPTNQRYNNSFVKELCRFMRSGKHHAINIISFFLFFFLAGCLVNLFIQN